MPSEFLRSRLTASEIALALREGLHIGDHAFDALLPNDSRTASMRFWSPVKVASMAAHWLEMHGAQRVLDVGAGSGKFCVIAALITDLVVEGIEQRPHLVEQARALAADLGVADRVKFTCAALEATTLEDYDALYLYNPFCEAGYDRLQWLDESLELAPDSAARDVARIEAALDAMPIGGQLVTYHGFGGRLPDTFELLHSWSFGGGSLRCWQNARPGPSTSRLFDGDWA